VGKYRVIRFGMACDYRGCNRMLDDVYHSMEGRDAEAEAQGFVRMGTKWYCIEHRDAKPASRKEERRG
jgi:hypothetical protein